MSIESPNWARLKEIVADALDAPAGERAALLDEACAGDTSLLQEALSLVQAYDESTGVIDARTDAYLGLGGPDLLSLSGRRIGKYRLVRVIAEGAMAAVYEARQMDPDRAVAIKLFRTNMTVLDAHQRFRREAQALARLQHPNIARIYEASVQQSPDGRAMPYIAMEFVDGLPLAEHARRHQLSRGQRIDLLIKVAQAVHAAHQQAVIHRDLKPANVLVDKTGEPKVLDFGIARIVGEDLETYTWQTTAGVLLGTPGYMSPEQASGLPHTVDVRSDVWSLGVMLHELLVDRLPIDVRSGSISEVLRRIEQAQPPPISSGDPTLRGDLETIVATALAPEKSQRYASALALADDLQRYLRHEPISARPPTTWYLVRKFARRNRGALAAATVIAALLVGGVIASSIGFVRASRQRDRAVVAERRSAAVNAFLQQMLSAPDASAGGSRNVTVVDALAKAEAQIATTFAADPLAEAEVRSTIGWTYHSLGEYARAEPQLRRAYEISVSQLGPDSATTLDRGNNLVTTLRWLYRPDEARALLDQLLPLAQKRFRDSDVVTLVLLENQAGIAHDKNEIDLAEKLYVDLVGRCDKLASEGVIQRDSSVATAAMNNLANLYIASAKYPQAEALLRELIARREKTQGLATVQQIVSRSNLGQTLALQGRAAEAETLLRSTLDDSMRVLGPDVDNTIAVRSSLAMALEALGRHDEAIALRRDNYERLRKTYGMKFGATVMALHNYAIGLLRDHRAAEADPLLQEAIVAAAEVWGADSTEEMQVRRSHALAQEELGQKAQAERTLTGLFESFKARLGPDHSQTLIAANNLGSLRVDDGRPEQAEPILVAALESAQRTGNRYLERWTRRNLGHCLARMGRFSDAQRELLLAYEQFKSADPAPDANDRTISRLAEMYEAWGKPAEAARWRATTQPAAPATQPDRH